MEEKIPALEAAYDEVHGSACPFPNALLRGVGAVSRPLQPSIRSTPPSRPNPDCPGARLNTLPDDFDPHSKIKLLLRRRLEAVEKRGSGIDWANAEPWLSPPCCPKARSHPPERPGQRPRHVQPAPQRLFDRKSGAPTCP
jgi:hypothetical protein